MRGLTLTPPETSMLADIVSACREPATGPLPWRVLELVQQLLHADWVTFVGLDSRQPRMRFIQHIDPEGRNGFRAETIAQAEISPFWAQYWDPIQGCSYADRTGDYTFVRRASEYKDVKRRGESWHVQACLPAEAPGKYTRVTAFRDVADFTEKDVLLLRILQPHFLDSYAVSTARVPTNELTPRQLEIMRMVRAGLSNRQIAGRLGVSEGTVHNHLTHIYARLGVGSRTAAIHAVFYERLAWNSFVNSLRRDSLAKGESSGG